MFVDLVWDLLRFVPFADVGFDGFGYPGADFFAERGVRFVEVGRVVLFPSLSVIVKE